MYPDARKLLTEPLLWVGAIALCIPVLASGQLGDLRELLSFEHGGPNVQSVAIAEVSGSIPKPSATVPIAVDPTQVGSQARGIAMEPEPAMEIAAPTIDLPAMEGGGNGSSIDERSMSARSQSRASEAFNKIEKTEELAPTLGSSPAISLSETGQDVAISPLPPPVDSADPGSLLDAARMLSYGNTQEPDLLGLEPIETEVASSPPGTSLELDFDDQAAESVSLDPVYDAPIGKESASEAGARSQFSALPRSSSGDESPLAKSRPAVPRPSASSNRLSYQQPLSIPSTPMKFQAALRQSVGRGYSQPNRLFESGSGTTNFRAALPTAARAFPAQSIRPSSQNLPGR